MSARPNSRLPISHALIVSAILALAPVALAEDAIIIESAPDGWNYAWFKTEGGWLSSTGKSKADGVVGTSSMFNTADDKEGQATFTPDIPADGQYEVFITYSGTANSKAVKYKIVHGTGEAEVIKDQNGRDPADLKPNSWISLGTFQFKKGTTGAITIMDPLTGQGANSVEPNLRVYADAIKLVPVGFKLPSYFSNRLSEGATPIAERKTPVPQQAGTATQPAATAQSPASAATPESNQATAGTPTALAPLPSSLAATPAPLPSDLPPAGSVTSPVPLEPGLTAPSASNNGSSPLPTLPSPGAIPADLPPLQGNTSMPNLASAVGSPTAPSSTDSSLPTLPSVPGSASSSSDSSMPTLPSVGSSPGSGSAPTAPALPSALPNLSTPTRPISNGASLPSLSDVASAPSISTPQSSSNAPLPLAPVNSAGLGSMPSLSSAGGSSSLGTGLASPTPTLISAPPRATPVMTPVAEDDGTGIQWSYDYYAALSAARSQSKQVLVFFTARGNRMANKYTTEILKDPTVRTALDKYILVKLDFPMNTRLAYRLGIFGAGQIAVVNSEDTKLGSIIQMPSSTTEFITIIEGMK